MCVFFFFLIARCVKQFRVAKVCATSDTSILIINIINPQFRPCLINGCSFRIQGIVWPTYANEKGVFAERDR